MFLFAFLALCRVGAARIQGIFHKIFGPELDSIDSGDGLTDSGMFPNPEILLSC